MTNKTEIDNFQNDVIKGINKYKDAFEPSDEQSLEDLLNQTRRKTTPPPDKSVEEAKKLLKSKDVRHYICPALLSLSKDAYEIGKAITSILLPLAIAKTITIHLDPIVISLASIMIAKMGVASLCTEYSKKET